MANLEAKSFVVIQTAFLGDIALTSSFLRDLRFLHPHARIVFVTTPAGVELFTPNPWNLELISFAKRGRDRGPRGLWKKARELARLKPDRIYCLHRSARSVLLTWLVQAKETIGFQEAALGFLLKKQVSRRDFLFEAEKNRAALLAGESVAPELPPPFPELFTSDADEAFIDDLLKGRREFVAIAPSSVWATKRWPAERFGQVAAEIWRRKRIPLVIVGADDQSDYAASRELLAAARKLIPEAEHEEALLDLTGKTKLGPLKALLGRAKVLLCNDSAPLHIALARARPVVAVFGSTTRSLGFFPLAPEGRSAVVEIERLECRPCGPHGHQACPQQHFRCMLDLAVPSVLKSLEPFL